MEFHQSSLCKGPEGFNVVDVTFPSREFILAMVYTIMFFVSQVNQAVIAALPIRMDDACGVNLAPDNGLERGSGAIGDDFGIDISRALQDAEYGCFSAGTTAAFPFDAFGAEG